MATTKPNLLERLLLRTATVTAATRHDTPFLHLHIQGDSLKSADWLPGQKVQFFISAFTTRTYTPLSWDARTGAAEFLIYLHGQGIASEWASHLAVGDEVRFFGPRGSVDLQQIHGPLVFVGDETSIALALSSPVLYRNPQALFIFESNDKAATDRTLSRVGLTAKTVQRQPEHGHLVDIESQLIAYLKPLANSEIVLTGRARSIQYLKRALKQQGIANNRIQSRAYWAEGKKGLD